MRRSEISLINLFGQGREEGFNNLKSFYKRNLSFVSAKLKLRVTKTKKLNEKKKKNLS